jgi:hypothetical protein
MHYISVQILEVTMQLLAFLSTTTKNRINPTLSNDTRNDMVIISLSLLQ